MQIFRSFWLSRGANSKSSLSKWSSGISTCISPIAWWQKENHGIFSQRRSRPCANSVHRDIPWRACDGSQWSSD
jgi:hypothetical protein